MFRGAPTSPQAGLRRELTRRDAPPGSQQARSTSAVSPSPSLVSNASAAAAHGRISAQLPPHRTDAVSSTAGAPTDSLGSAKGDEQLRSTTQAKTAPGQRVQMPSHLAASRTRSPGSVIQDQRRPPEQASMEGPRMASVDVVRHKAPPSSIPQAQAQPLSRGSSTVPQQGGMQKQYGYVASPSNKSLSGQEMHGMEEALLKDLMGLGAKNSPPSEAASQSASSVAPASSTGVAAAYQHSESLNLEERIRRLENSLDEKLIKATSEAMSASVTLCKAAEDRFTQKLEVMRRELIQEVQQIVVANVQEVAAAARASGSAMDGQEVLRNDLLHELHQTIGQEVSTLRFELAARGVPVTAGLPDTSELEALAPPGSSDQPRKTGIAGLVGIISDCVIERVKEDQCIRNVSEQHDQLKEAIQELRSLPGMPSSAANSDSGGARQAELENLHGMVKEMVKISYSLAKEIGTEREQRARDFCEAQERLEGLEQGKSGNSAAPAPQGERSLSASSRQLARPSSLQRPGAKRLPQGTSKMGVVDNGGSLERVMGGLQRLANNQSLSEARPDSNPPQQPASSTNPNRNPSTSPHGRALLREPSQSSQASANDDTSSWSTEVRALRSRLENIFQIGGSQDPLAPTTGSGLSGTVGSLPTVQEATVA